LGAFVPPNRPVEQVSWDECREFCVKLTAHRNGQGAVALPTDRNGDTLPL
jgi:hypothetical protein